MLKQDKLYLGSYNDVYGGLLTAQQREMCRLYYDCDMSLAEIAEDSGISKQAVRDCIVRAENLLEDFEAKLKTVEKMQKITACIDKVLEVFDGDAIQAKQLLKELKEGLD